MAENQHEKDFIEPKQEDLGKAQEELEPDPKVETEPQPEVEREPDRQLNYSIPIAVAKISWPHDPAMADNYVQTTAPLLDLIEFHKCLKGMGDLPPMVRLALGLAVITGGVVVMKVTQQKQKKEPREKAKATPPDERRATGEDQLPGSPEGKASDVRPVREESDGAGGADGGASRPSYQPYARRGQ